MSGPKLTEGLTILTCLNTISMLFIRVEILATARTQRLSVSSFSQTGITEVVLFGEICRWKLFTVYKGTLTLILRIYQVISPWCLSHFDHAEKLPVISESPETSAAYQPFQRRGCSKCHSQVCDKGFRISSYFYNQLKQLQNMPTVNVENRQNAKVIVSRMDRRAVKKLSLKTVRTEEKNFFATLS